MAEVPHYEEVGQAHDDCLAEGVLIAAEMGMRVHCCTSREGSVKPEHQKRFNYVMSEKIGAWLKYTLRHPEYFSEPEKLLTEIIQKNSSRYKAKGIDLEKALKGQSGMNDQQLIFGYWLRENKNNFSFGLITQKDRWGFKDQQAVDAFIADRQKQDKSVMARMNKFRGDEKAAVFYGAAHIRHIHGGFTQGMAADQYAVFSLIPTEKMEDFFSTPEGRGLAPHLHADDNVIFVNQNKMLKASELDIPAPSRPAVQTQAGELPKTGHPKP